MGPTLKMQRFAGVSLAGGKTDKTAVAILEYYPQQKRLFLRSLRDRLRGEGGVSGDAVLHSLLSEEEAGLSLVAFDVPLQMPKCLRCKLRCPGYEKCKEPEIRWMWEHHRKLDDKKRPNKLFTPYTERCAEKFIATELEEPFHPSHAFGANAAPLAARALFLRRRLKVKVMETYPKLALWRLGRALKVPKSYLRSHKHSVDGDEARHIFLQALIAEQIAFIYQQDLKTMVEHNQPFDAFVCALTAYLRSRGQCEKSPAGYPKGEAWIDYPSEHIVWF